MEFSGTGNHLDHFIRQTRVHHMHLSSMADTKANIMLTISALIITFSIGHLSDPHLRWPVLVLIVLFIQKRPQGMFALKGSAVES